MYFVLPLCVYICNPRLVTRRPGGMPIVVMWAVDKLYTAYVHTWSFFCCLITIMNPSYHNCNGKFNHHFYYYYFRIHILYYATKNKGQVSGLGQALASSFYWKKVSLSLSFETEEGGWERDWCGDGNTATLPPAAVTEQGAWKSCFFWDFFPL